MAKKAKRSKKRSTKKKATRKAKKKTVSKPKRQAPQPRQAHNSGWAVVGTIPILGFILVYLLEKRNDYAMYYAKQGLALGLVGVVLDIILTLLVVTIPLTFFVGVAVVVLWIMSVVNATSGKKKRTPWVGKLGENLNL